MKVIFFLYNEGVGGMIHLIYQHLSEKQNKAKWTDEKKKQ